MENRTALLRCWLLCGVSYLAAVTPTAFAFQEDICPDGAGGWTECLESTCNTEGEPIGCAEVSMLTALASSAFLKKARGEGARSTLHFDATYLMAQAVGFTPRDAYVLAAYNAATDLGRYIHRDQQGGLPVNPDDCAVAAPPPACALYSRSIDGVVRDNFTEGGVFFHFMALPQRSSSADGLAPPVTDRGREAFLYHVRRWVYGEGPLCVGGLVDASGANCFVSPVRSPSSLVGRLPFESATAALTSVDWVAEIDEQKVASDPVTGRRMPASQLDRYLPSEDIVLAQLGIYLHALADRVSHHLCINASEIRGPRDADAGVLLLNPLMDLLFQTSRNLGSLPAYLQSLQLPVFAHDPDYLFAYDNEECDQANHFLRHSWETGQDHRQLAPDSQTALHGLLAVLVELEQFADRQRFPGRRALSEQQRLDLVHAILDATDKSEPQERVDALTTLAQQRGWLPLPLHGGLDLDSWQARAGKAQTGGNAAVSDATDSGGGALDGLTLVLLGLLLLVSVLRPAARLVSAAPPPDRRLARRA